MSLSHSEGGLSKLKLHHSFDHLVLLCKIEIDELGRGDSTSNLTILAKWMDTVTFLKGNSFKSNFVITHCNV